MEDELSAADLYANVREILSIDRDLGMMMLPRVAKPEAYTAVKPQRQATPVVKTPAKAAVTAPTRDRLPPSDASHLADLPDTGSKADRLQAIAGRIADCQRCALCQKRTNTVPGEGHEDTELMFIGEGPGADEDRTGRPFVGAAGALLTKMIIAMGLTRDEVFIANVIKCRPPGNRDPEPEEMAACLSYLEKQVDIIQPKVICSLGRTPLRALTGNLSGGITRARGKPFQWQGIPVVPTFHPSYLLRNPGGKKAAWQDLQQVLQILGREIPKK